MVRDLEEMLLKVQDGLSRDFVREGVRCYYAGAFKAAVVVAVAAGLDDLRRKLLHLKITGAGRAIADVSDDVEAKLIAQEAWEQQLLDGCKASDVLSPAEYGKLTAVLKIRHLCAHPSGHSGSAEEARDVIATCVDIVLSRPPLVGGAEIETLVSIRLANANYFGAADEAAVRTATAAEIAKFRPTVLRGVANRLGKVIETEPPGSTLHKNAVLFLGAMAASEHPQASEHAWAAIGLLLASAGGAGVFPILASAPDGLHSVEEVVRLRALGLVRANLQSTDALAVLAAWLRRRVLTEEERRDFLARIKAEVLTFPSSPTAAECKENVSRAADVVAALEWSDLWTAYADWLVASADHGTFYIANATIERLRVPSAAEMAHFSDEQKSQAVMNIIAAAGRGAWEAEHTCRNGMRSAGDFVARFVASLQGGRIEFSSAEWKWAELLLTLTLGRDLAVEIAKAIESGAVKSKQREFVVTSMRASSIPEIKALSGVIDRRAIPTPEQGS